MLIVLKLLQITLVVIALWLSGKISSYVNLLFSVVINYDTAIFNSVSKNFSTLVCLCHFSVKIIAIFTRVWSILRQFEINISNCWSVENLWDGTKSLRRLSANWSSNFEKNFRISQETFWNLFATNVLLGNCKAAVTTPGKNILLRFWKKTEKLKTSENFFYWKCSSGIQRTVLAIAAHNFLLKVKKRLVVTFKSI